MNRVPTDCSGDASEDEDEPSEEVEPGSCTRADQKLVSEMFLPSGRSMMNLPSWSVVQKPARAALEVQT